MDSHLSLLKDIKYILIAILIMVVVSAISIKINFDRFKNDIEQEIRTESIEAKMFLNNNSIIFEKEKGNYVLRLVKENKNDRD